MSQAIAAAPANHVYPITVEVIGSALSSITEEMGEALVRASYSTNIKERRDCSTALFHTRGDTLCQAEHIPMHLGSFIGIIPHILKRHPVAEMRPGDVFVGNDANEGGGTHLPDIVLAERKGAFVFGPGVEPFPHGSGVLKKGQTIEIVTPGAGGYGPPEKRDAEALRRDAVERRGAV